MADERIVFVVDDDAAVRDALHDLLDSVGLRTVCFGSAEEFLASYRGTGPACMVLDVRMPNMDGLKLQQKLAGEGVRLPVIFLTSHGDVQMAVQAMQRGAVDFIEKPFREQALLDSVYRALEQDAAARAAEAETQAMQARFETLTPREREVLEQVMAGKTSKLIAEELGLSPKTIDQHRAKIMEKMEADNIVALVQAVLQARREIALLE